MKNVHPTFMGLGTDDNCGLSTPSPANATLFVTGGTVAGKLHDGDPGAVGLVVRSCSVGAIGHALSRQPADLVVLAELDPDSLRKCLPEVANLANGLLIVAHA